MPKLDHYLAALRCLHCHENFWLFDAKRTLLYAHSLQCNIEELQIVIDFNLYRQISLLDYINQLVLADAQPIELIVFQHQSGPAHLMLMSFHSISHCGQKIAFYLLARGLAKDFEYANLIRLLLFGPQVNPYLSQKLTPREKEIIFFSVRGNNYRQIAKRLSQIYARSIASSTIANIMRNSIYKKFNVNDHNTLKQLLFKSGLLLELPLTSTQRISHAK